MEFRQLETFVTIVKLSSFTKAADELSYAQSSVTSHIQALETELGTILFERIGKHIKLTQDGERFFIYAEQLLKLSHEALDFSSGSDNPGGTITIGTPESLCLFRLADVFKDFRDRYSKVEINLVFGIYQDFLTQLRKNAIDMAFFLDRPCRENDLMTHVLFEERMSVIAAPSHPLSRKDRIVPQDIHNQALILTDKGCGYRRVLENILAQAEINASSILSVSSIDVIKRFVADGWGIGFLPYVTVKQELAQGQLVDLPWAGPAFDIHAQVMYHKEKWFSPALKAFFELTLERLKMSEIKV
jgi:Transcriptional regulator